MAINGYVLKAWQDSSSPDYKIGLAVKITGNTPSSPTCSVTVIPCLQNKAYTEHRYQHYWNVHIMVDGDNKYTKMLLPNNNSAPGVVSAGYLSMTKGEWYQWGGAKTFTFNNDGKTKHTIGVYLHCTNTKPRHSPALNTHLMWEFTPNKYTVTPSTPAGITVNFDEATREMKISWSKPTNTVSTSLACTLYDEAGERIGDTGEYAPSSTSYTIKLQDTVARVDYTIAHKSSTGHTATAIGSYKNIPTDCKVWIKLSDSKWVKVVPWVKLPDGTWKKATKTYVKVGDVWKRTIM